MMTGRLFYHAMAIIFLSAAFSFAATAQDVPLAQVTAEAETRFKTISAAYQELPAYADRGLVTVTVTDANKKQVSRRRGSSLQFVRGTNLLKVNCGSLIMINDGKTFQLIDVPNNSLYQARANVPLTVSLEGMNDDHRRSNAGIKEVRDSSYNGLKDPDLVFGAVAGQLVAIPLTLLVEPDPLRILRREGGVFDVEDDRTIEDRLYRVLVLRESGIGDWRLYSDVESQLIRRIEVIWKTEQLATIGAHDRNISEVSLLWESREVTTDPGEVETRVRRSAEVSQSRTKGYDKRDVSNRDVPKIFVPVPPGDGTFAGLVKRLVDWLKGND